MLRLPETLREALKTPFGPVVQNDGLADAIQGADPLIAVGDVTALTLIEGGHAPKLIMIDYKNERREMGGDDPRRETLASYGDHCISIHNPAASITRELEDAIDRALAEAGTFRIEIEGEEDLGVLPCMVKAGPDARIVYGMPGKGMVVVTNDAARAAWAGAFMARMERV